MTNKDANHLIKYLKRKCADCKKRLRVVEDFTVNDGIKRSHKWIECEDQEGCGYQDEFVKCHKDERLEFDC